MEHYALSIVIMFFFLIFAGGYCIDVLKIEMLNINVPNSITQESCFHHNHISLLSRLKRWLQSLSWNVLLPVHISLKPGQLLVALLMVLMQTLIGAFGTLLSVCFRNRSAFHRGAVAEGEGREVEPLLFSSFHSETS